MQGLVSRIGPVTREVVSILVWSQNACSHSTIPNNTPYPTHKNPSRQSETKCIIDA